MSRGNKLHSWLCCRTCWLSLQSPAVLTLLWLQNWLSLISTYVKAIDPNHLVYYGTPAFFGASTPSL